MSSPTSSSPDVVIKAIKLHSIPKARQRDAKLLTLLLLPHPHLVVVVVVSAAVGEAEVLHSAGINSVNKVTS